MACQFPWIHPKQKKLARWSYVRAQLFFGTAWCWSFFFWNLCRKRKGKVIRSLNCPAAWGCLQPFRRDYSWNSQTHRRTTDPSSCPVSRFIRRINHWYLFSTSKSSGFLKVSSFLHKDLQTTAVFSHLWHKEYTAGKYFGELGMLTARPRAAWIMAKTYCVLSAPRSQCVHARWRPCHVY